MTHRSIADVTEECTAGIPDICDDSGKIALEPFEWSAVEPGSWLSTR
jgi:hypothetical protein